MANLDTMAMLASVDGILLVDKPARISSHDVLKAVKTQFNLAKIGHGGTLEPNATGLLVLLVGDATTVANDVMGGDRRYTATIRLGRTTNTQDAEGETLAEEPFDAVTREALDAALPEFRGDIFQTPPPFVTFDLFCTRGVCVRALAHDLGQKLGCGASLETLRRTSCGRFKVEDALGFMDLLKLDAVSFKHRLRSTAGAFA